MSPSEPNVVAATGDIPTADASIGEFATVLDDNVDRKYLEQWAGRLGVAELMRKIDDE